MRAAQRGHRNAPISPREPAYPVILLRGGASDDEIVNEIAAVWRARGDRYSEIRTAETAKQRKVEMSYIGG